MIGPRTWRLGVLGIALALVTLPSIGPATVTAQPSSIEVSVEGPGDGALIQNGQPIEIRGWAVDTSSEEGTGIATIEISVDALNGTATAPMFATYGNPRPDVVQVYGRPDWGQSGFTYVWTPEDLPEGPQTIRVWAHSAQQVSRSIPVALRIGPSEVAIRATIAAGSPTPTPTRLPLPGGLRVEESLFNCSIDMTLLAPSSFTSRMCLPTRTPSPTRGS